ncbi:MAG: hypothetical protein GY842_28990, partial [bacterium]|nr:hypothetical protein [bacterium]
MSQLGCTQVGGTWLGEGTDCFGEPCALPTGACCYTDGSCTVLTSADCSSSGGTYQGDDTVCSPNPCPQPTGACCYTDGSCLVQTSADCGAGGGTYAGNDVTCIQADCPQPTGACCLPLGGGCLIGMDEAGCIGVGGAWQGAGTNCTPDPCTQPTVSCCFADETCQELTFDECTAAGGLEGAPGSTCDPNPCTTPSGACCFEDDSCQILSVYPCESQGGSYIGPGEPCGNCPEAACCFADLSCQVLNPLACQAAGGIYKGSGAPGESIPCDDSICQPEAGGDTCAEAPLITEGSVFGTTTGGTNSASSSCRGGTGAIPDVWYKYTNPDSFPRFVTFSTCNEYTDFDTSLAAYDACGGTEVACNRYDGSSSACTLYYPPYWTYVKATLFVEIPGGATYYILVDGDYGESGDFQLDVSYNLIMPNDDCANATELAAPTDYFGTTTVIGNTSNATQDGTAECAGVGDGPDVWYKVSGDQYNPIRLRATTCAATTDFDTVLEVYDACDGALIACNDDACGTQSSVVWTIPPRLNDPEVHYIRVFGANGATGQFQLDLVLDSHEVTCGVPQLYGWLGTSAKDITIPTLDPPEEIRITGKGGNGGDAWNEYCGYFGCDEDCRSVGGGGAEIAATFTVGTGAGELAPGGTLRLIIGGAGETGHSVQSQGVAVDYGGGGGGTAVLYQAPDVTGNNCSDWTILVAAGGGG